MANLSQDEYATRDRSPRSLESWVALGLSLVATVGFGAYCFMYLAGFAATAG